MHSLQNNRQVASFVYTTLHAYANSTDLCDKKMCVVLLRCNVT